MGWSGRKTFHQLRLRRLAKSFLPKGGPLVKGRFWVHLDHFSSFLAGTTRLSFWDLYHENLLGYLQAWPGKCGSLSLALRPLTIPTHLSAIHESYNLSGTLRLWLWKLLVQISRGWGPLDPARLQDGRWPCSLGSLIDPRKSFVLSLSRFFLVVKMGVVASKFFMRRSWDWKLAIGFSGKFPPKLLIYLEKNTTLRRIMAKQ